MQVHLFQHLRSQPLSYYHCQVIDESTALGWIVTSAADVGRNDGTRERLQWFGSEAVEKCFETNTYRWKITDVMPMNYSKMVIQYADLLY
jgi:hypothetical protein